MRMERATSSHQTTPEIRGAIIGMHKAGINATDIAKHLGIHRDTARLWIKRFKKNGTLETKKRSGRPRATTKDQDNAIVNAILENSSLSAMQIYREMRPSCSRKTVLSRIKEAGFYCQKVEEVPRILYAQQSPQRNISWACDSIDVADIKEEPELVEPLIGFGNTNMSCTELTLVSTKEATQFAKPFKENQGKLNGVNSSLCINTPGVKTRSGPKYDVKDEGEYKGTFLECEAKLDERENNSISTNTDNLPTKQNSSKLNEEKIIYESLPFKCKICDCKFKQKFDLLSHAASVHNMTQVEDSECQNTSTSEKVKQKTPNLQGSKVYYCRLCTSTAITKEQLREHYAYMHKKDNEYLCTVCPQSFRKLGNLTQHISSVHEKNKAFQCGLCEYRCNQKGSLNRHIAGVHGKVF